jgi:hypothetical protein
LTLAIRTCFCEGEFHRLMAGLHTCATRAPLVSY